MICPVCQSPLAVVVVHVGVCTAGKSCKCEGRDWLCVACRLADPLACRPGKALHPASVTIEGRRAQGWKAPNERRKDAGNGAERKPRRGKKKPGLIGKAVKLLRRRLRLTQQEIASRLGISESFVCGLESGRLHPALAMRERLTDAVRELQEAEGASA